MPDTAADVTRRIFARGRKHAGSRLWKGGWPLLCCATLIIVSGSLVHAVLPPIRGLAVDQLAYYRECSVAMVLLPRLTPIGLFVGMTAFVLAMKMGDRRASVFCGSILAVFAVSLMVTLALWISGGSNEAGYASATVGDVFRVAVLPIGVPASVGAVLGVGVATVS
jgi:hypothetical protein